MQPHDLPQPGDVVAGKYTVDRLLGRGGMGAVYVVSHRLTGKRLALKCLLPEHLENADIVERFLREAQAAGRIQHRYVVDVFDVGRDGGLLYIVMELLDGKAFSELLHDEALTLEETLGILVRAMEGVAAAHALNIVHRDLKPDNIFVSVGNSGRLDDPRVLDFGISKVEDDASQPLTRSGVAMGTPYYMSLEQMSGQRDLDARVDVYAMGVILYESIAGHPPHIADSVSALAIRMLTTPPVHLAQIRPDLPAGLADVVMKALARDREQRYPTMQALIDAIRPFVPQGAGLLVPEGKGRPLRTPRSGHSPSAGQLGPLAAPTTPPTSGSAPLGVESAATIAAPTTPPGARGAVATPVQPSGQTGAQARGRSASLALVAVLALAGIVIGVWWFGIREPAASAKVHAPPPPSMPAPAATVEPAKVEPAPAPAVVGAKVPEQVEPDVTVAPADPKAKDKSGRRKHGAGKASEGEQTAPEPGSPSQVKGRAGELAPGDF